jgi:flavin-dependent dehydrogenase
MTLVDGSRIAVVGGGPAGSFFCCFLMEMAGVAGLDLQVDLYEPNDFSKPGPAGCNHCGGIVSESLVQTLAVEGINLPSTVVQRGIDSYALHMDVGTVRIDTPLQEKRIAAMIRGAGPKGIQEIKWGTFDGFLQCLAVDRGVRVIHEKINGFSWNNGLPSVKTKKGEFKAYDLAVIATGVNSGSEKLFKGNESLYRPPGTTKTVIREYYLGANIIEEYLGSSMHVFLLDVPRLEFAALIPKADYVTVCMLGEDIDQALVESFLQRREVIECMPPGWDWQEHPCRCAPKMNVTSARQPFGDRVVFIGDCGVARLFKDGIGSAYRTAKAAATTAVFHGVAEEDFKRHFWPVCRSIKNDNGLGRVVFFFTGLLQKWGIGRRAILSMVRAEQRVGGRSRLMSQVLWDTFTGSAPYSEIFLRTLRPAFAGRLLRHLAASLRHS